MAAMFRALLLVIALVTTPAAEKPPELRSSNTWINTDGPLKLSSLKGKVVLIDFWAFDCEPCKETVPRVEALYERYSSKGLVVIGIHTPRTSEEKEIPKLRDAVKRMGIQYPVVVDANQKMFSDYRCDLWPTQFVIDRKGFVRISRGGVSRSTDIEQAIQDALTEA
jgi:thiol-disulfide isomerase/thioredoxin